MLFCSILEQCFLYNINLNKYKGTSSNNADSDAVELWDALIHKVNEIIDKVCSM